MRALSSRPCLPPEGRGVFVEGLPVLRLLTVLLLFIRLLCPPAASSGELKGTVLHARTGIPLADVLIAVNGTNAGKTLRDGSFHLPIPPSSGTLLLRFRKFGFETVEQRWTPADSTRDELHILLPEAVFPSSPVVTTATRADAPSDAVPASVTVVNASDLGARTSIDVGEILEGVPGVVTRSYGALGDVRTVSLRGSTASQVLVLLNGQRLNSAQTGEVDLSVLPLVGVQRVEILRGGASAQYGADAVGGVVNIITDTSPEEGSRISLEGLVGSFGSRSLAAGASTAGSWGSVAVQARSLHSDGDFAYPGIDGTMLTRKNADVTTRSVTARSTLWVGDGGGRTSLNAGYTDQQSGDPGMVGLLSPDARKRNTLLSMNLSMELPSGVHTPGVHLFVHDARFRYRDPSAYVPVNNGSENTGAGIEIVDRATVLPWLVVTGGGGWRTDRFWGTSLREHHQRDAGSAFLQGEIRPLDEGAADDARIMIQPAVRWDRFQDFGSQLSPKLGVRGSIGSPLEIMVKSNAGLSFRAPTFNDLYWPRDNFSVGNSSLAPERSFDADAGVHILLHADPGASLGLTWFSNTIHDLILWEPGNGGIWSPVNVGKAAVTGWEVETQAGPLLKTITASWSYTFLHAVDRSGLPNEDGLQLPYRPAHLHTMRIEGRHDALRASLEFRYMSRRYVTPANTKYLPQVHTVDCAVEWTWNSGTGTASILLAAKNIADVSYAMIDGYPVPGRELRLTVGYTIDVHP